MIAKRKGVIVRLGLKEVWNCKFGGCVRKAGALTSRDLPFVLESNLTAPDGRSQQSAQ